MSADDERPHLAALRDGDSTRRATVAPPPRPRAVPAPTAQPGPDLGRDDAVVPEKAEAEPESPTTTEEPVARPAKRPSRSNAAAKPVSPATGGRQRGNRREFQVRLTETVASLLYELSERERMTLGQAAMAAVRREHKALRSETVTTVEDDGFAPVELTRRQLAATEPKRLVTIRVTRAEAEAFDKLADDTRMSYSLLLDEAIRRAHGLKDQSSPPT